MIWKDGVTQEEPDITFLPSENGGTYVARFADGSVRHVSVKYAPSLPCIPSAHELKKLARQKQGKRT